MAMLAIERRARDAMSGGDRAATSGQLPQGGRPGAPAAPLPMAPTRQVRDERNNGRGSFVVPDALVVVDRPRPYRGIVHCVDCGNHFPLHLGVGMPPKRCRWCLRDRAEGRKRRRASNS